MQTKQPFAIVLFVVLLLASAMSAILIQTMK